MVDTGGWLSTRKFVLPASGLRSSSRHEHDFSSDLTKQQIESFPPYNERDVESEDKWKEYEGRYRSKWDIGPVMHREGSDRNITPTTQQMGGNQSSLRASGDYSSETPGARSGAGSSDRDRESLRAASASPSRIVLAGTDSVVISNSAVGIGGRWDTFQARLRERRKEAAMGCRTCSTGLVIYYEARALILLPPILNFLSQDLLTSGGDLRPQAVGAAREYKPDAKRSQSRSRANGFRVLT